MEARSAPAPTRYPPFLTSSLHTPSAPIPIPARRVTTDPPPRSPNRSQPLSDLLFDMSPLSPTDSPLRKRSSFQAHDSESASHRITRAHPERPLGQRNDPSGDPPIYPHEPFLYSIPRLALPSNILHRRSRSELVNPKLMKNSLSSGFIPTGSVSPSSLSNPSCSPSTTTSGDFSVHRFGKTDDTQNLLTSAFQVSISSDTYTTISSVNASSPEYMARHAISPTGSVCVQNANFRGRKSTARSTKQCKAEYPAILRTSAAAPVLSFAQAELASHVGAGKYPRATKVKARSPPYTTCPVRPRSPHASKGRKNSALHDRTSRISDEELGGTLKYEYGRDKFGLEKYIPMACSKRVGRNENVTNDDGLLEMERGRPKTRGRSRA